MDIFGYTPHQYEGTISFITLDDADNPVENERIELLMSLPRFRGHNRVPTVGFENEPTVFSVDDLAFLYYTTGDFGDICDFCGAFVCMDGVLKKNRTLISDLMEICAGYGIPVYFEDILDIELKELERKVNRNEERNDIGHSNIRARLYGRSDY